MKNSVPLGNKRKLKPLPSEFSFPDKLLKQMAHLNCHPAGGKRPTNTRDIISVTVTTVKTTPKLEGIHVKYKFVI
jgi:hypothetical protein